MNEKQALIQKNGLIPITEMLFRKAVREKIPLHATFELSPICNLACKMCYIRKNPEEVNKHPRKIMNLEEWIELAQEIRKQGTLYLLLTGGEPFLWPDFWSLYEQLYQMGFLISINTNGSMINDECIARLCEMPPNRINITLYGSSDETYYNLCCVHGIYDRVINTILKLKKEGILVRINCSITPENADDIEQIIDFAKKNELELQTTTYMFPPIRKGMNNIGDNARFSPEEAAYYQLKIKRKSLGEQSYKQILKNILQGTSIPLGVQEDCLDVKDGKLRCRAGKAAFWVTWDGYISLCGMIPKFHVDYREKNFTEAWRCINKLSDELKLSGVCEACDYLKNCHACAAMAIAETGDVTKVPVYMCKMIQAMKKIAKEEWKSLYIDEELT